MIQAVLNCLDHISSQIYYSLRQILGLISVWKVETKHFTPHSGVTWSNLGIILFSKDEIKMCKWLQQVTTTCLIKTETLFFSKGLLNLFLNLFKYVFRELAVCLDCSNVGVLVISYMYMIPVLWKLFSKGRKQVLFIWKDGILLYVRWHKKSIGGYVSKLL